MTETGTVVIVESGLNTEILTQDDIVDIYTLEGVFMTIFILVAFFSKILGKKIKFF